jgi:hypothetical protein
MLKALAGKFRCVTPDLEAKAASRSPGGDCLVGAKMSRAPDRVLRQSSKRNTSKLTETNCRRLLLDVNSRCLIWLKARLGIPV